MANEDNIVDLEADDDAKKEDPVIADSNSKRKRLKSDVWPHFIIPNPVPKVDPRTCCKYCGRDYAFDPSNIGTSSLRNHLKKCLKYPFRKQDDKKQKTLYHQKGIGGVGGSLTAIAFNKDVCRKALARMIIIDELSFRFVEKEGFKYFCSVMQPKFEVPSRVTIARDIMSLYVEEREKLKLMFSNSSQQICLTTDTWTSIQNINYMVLTAHFIDHNFKLQKRILNFETITDHKGDTIGKMIEACLISWGIERVLTITVDNAKSNDVALTYLKKKICKWGKATLDCKFLHMRCCAHILNLVVTNGLKEYDSSIQVIRNAVRYVRSSPSRLNKFKQCVEHEKIDFSGSVCLDVPTRWNSTFLMLESALKFRMAFERLEDDSQYVGYFNYDSSSKVKDENKKQDITRMGPPCSSDWDAAENFMKFLELFYLVTKGFSGSLYVTSNIYFHDLCTIYTHLTTCINDNDPKLSLLASEMKVKFDKYWSDLEEINPYLFIAVVLDPRYKQGYVDWSFNDMYGIGDFSDEMSQMVTDNLKSLFNHYCARYPDYAKQGSSSQKTTNEYGNYEVEVKDHHQRRLLKFKSFCKEGNDGEKTELDRYLADAKEDISNEFDLLGWWKMNSTKYKILSRIAMDVLAIPVSTVASESAFSTGGRVLDSFRSRLTPKSVQALICLQNWLRSEVSQEKIDIPATLQEMEDLDEIEDIEKDFASHLNLCTDHIE